MKCRNLLRRSVITLLFACLCALGAGAHAAGGRSTDDPVIGSRLLHYRVQCHPEDRCNVECYQGGRIVVSRARLAPADVVTLVMTDGFSDRLQPLWLEIQPDGGKNKRTLLLPRDVLCDFQGLTITPLGR
jgi:hypothetical protein